MPLFYMHCFQCAVMGACANDTCFLEFFVSFGTFLSTTCCPILEIT